MLESEIEMTEVYMNPPEEKDERFRRLMENQENSRQKELYKCECSEEEGV